MGYTGKQLLATGYVYVAAPYIPLVITEEHLKNAEKRRFLRSVRKMLGSEEVEKQRVMSLYGPKLVNSAYYGNITVRI